MLERCPDISRSAFRVVMPEGYVPTPFPSHGSANEGTLGYGVIEHPVAQNGHSAQTEKELVPSR